jgi:cytochrome c-type biogenesis protein CcmH/NrfF
LRKLLGLGLCLAAALAAPAPAQEPAACFDERGYEQATRTILCDCGCHPQSVHDCACGRAAEMRREIRDEMVAECLSGDDLIALYVERHGDQIRIAPTAAGFNLVAWLGPLVALLGASTLIFFVLRRWSGRREAPAPVAAAPEGAAGDDSYRDRLRDALESME